MKQSMILLHGLFGRLSNWTHVIAHYKDHYDLHIPALPIYDDSSDEDKLNYLTGYIHDYITARGLKNVIMVGNSLGGHVAILYTHRYPEHVSHLVLTGSSGLYENTSMGKFPRRSSRAYIKERTAHTFYNPAMVSEDMISDVMEITTDAVKCLNMVRTAKSTQRNFVADLLPEITTPTLLLWGENDTITPINVAEQFQQLLADAQLVTFKNCGHAPMMEQPEQFNEALDNFLKLKTATNPL